MNTNVNSSDVTSSEQAKSMARNLRSALNEQSNDISHSKALELIAAAMGYADWNTASAHLEKEVSKDPLFEGCNPILRIFDERKALEFYCDFLGFEVIFEHRHEKNLPLYMGIQRAGAQLHLTEHHGDATPGSNVFVPTINIRKFHRELIKKQYSFARPNLEELPWGMQIQVHDPFGNRIRFCERTT